MTDSLEQTHNGERQPGMEDFEFGQSLERQAGELSSSHFSGHLISF